MSTDSGPSTSSSSILPATSSLIDTISPSSSLSSMTTSSVSAFPALSNTGLPPYLGINTNAPIIAVDIDECLNNLLIELNTFVNTNYNTNWKIEDYHSYHFVDVWGGTEQDAAEKVTKFFSLDILDKMAPIKEARTILTKYANDFRFIIVTSRNLDMAERTRTWVSMNYPGCFAGIHFGNHYGTAGKKQTKGEICKSIGAIALIDDNVHYIREACNAVGLGILFGKYRWNHLSNDDEDALPRNVIRAINWNHIDTILYRIKQLIQNIPLSITISPPPTISSSAITNGLSLELVDTINTTISRSMVKSTLTISQTEKNTLEQIIAYIRRILEIQNLIMLTANGNDTTVLMNVIDRFTIAGDAIIVSMHTAVDSAPVSATRIPRLTITIRRTYKFLESHYITQIYRNINKYNNKEDNLSDNDIIIPVPSIADESSSSPSQEIKESVNPISSSI